MIDTLPLVTRGHKRKITQGNVSWRNVSLMAKYVEDPQLREGWRDLLHPWERLKWARLYWQHQSGIETRTAKQAADALNMGEGTYRTYERPEGSSKHTPLTHQRAIEFGRKFKVSWTWILLNHGTPFDQMLGPAQERVLQIMSTADNDQQDTIADMIEAYLNSQAQKQRQAQG